MANTKNTKRALLASTLALILCFSMLLGTTYAWFTDSVTSANNIITAGNLDIELEYAKVVDGQMTEWAPVEGEDEIFDPKALWEPGRYEVVYLRVSNLGSLALKYQLSLNVYNEVAGVNVYGEEFKLSEYLVFATVEETDALTTYADREAALAATNGKSRGMKDYNGKTTALEVGGVDYVSLIVYMPTDVGNDANYATGTTVPSIEFGINLVATQQAAEEDSFGADYDADAWHPEMTIYTVEDMQVALENGVNAKLGADIAWNDDLYLTANLDLGGNTLTAEYITAAENAEIVNGTIVMPDEAYVYAWNGATVTLENVTIDSDKISAYAATNGTLVLKNVAFDNTATSNPIQNYGGTLVMDNVTVGQAGDANTAWYSSAVQVINNIVMNNETGKYEITAQANTTINSGNYAGKAALFVSAPGGNVTINGGTFVGSEYAINAQFSPQNYTYGADYESVITITGGDFTGALKFFPATEVVITGGTFSVDPSAYLADGYKAVLVGDRYAVVEDVVTYATASTAAELQAALDNAANQNLIVLTDDIVGNVTVKQISNLVITVNGNGHKFAGTFVVDGNSATERTSGVTLKNIVFEADNLTPDYDAIVSLGEAGKNSTRYTCNVTVDNCHFDVPGAVGVKSYTGGDKNLVIKNCTTSEDLHSLAQLKGIDGVLVEGCTVTSVRGINFNNSLNVTVTNCTIDVQKYAVRFGESDNTTVENYAITNCTLKSANVDNDAVIVLRAGATNANLTLTNTSVIGTLQMTGHENAHVVVQ